MIWQLASLNACARSAPHRDASFRVGSTAGSFTHRIGFARRASAAQNTNGVGAPPGEATISVSVVTA
jgi:hypothetical protein